MTRHLLTAAVLLLLPAVATAQFRTGRGGFGGGVRPVSPGVAPVSPFMPGISPAAGPISPGAGNFGGGFGVPGRQIFPPIWGGGWFPGYGYGYPDYGFSGPTIVINQAPAAPVAVQPPEPTVVLSGEGVATLVLEFPTAAKVWVNGTKAVGGPDAEWTLTSSSLVLGTEFAFTIKAKWTFNGKTYEFERTYTVPAGNRSKALVVSGTQVKE